MNNNDLKILKLKRELKQNREDLRRKVKILSTLNVLSDRMSQILSLSALLKEIIRLSRKILKFSKCAILLFNENKELYIIASAGYKRDLVKSIRIKIGEGVTGWVAKNRKSLLVQDTEEDSRYIEGIKGGRSNMAVPLIINQRIIGVLNAESTEVNAFSNGDLEIFQIFAQHTTNAIENARLFEKIHTTYFQTIRSLVQALEARDAYTKGHSERVTKLALRIAKRMNLKREEIKEIIYAGILHDIGKIGISDIILHKRVPLTRKEWEAIKSHPHLGDAILEPIYFLKKAQESILHHHERFDGTGYPDNLIGQKIPMTSRIIAIADAYDAMRSRRTYRNSLSRERTIDEIKKNSGIQFDPEIVKIFLEMKR